MPDAPLLYEVEDHVAVITLNQPEKMNAFSPEMLELWTDAIARSSRDEDVRAIVVTGSGRGFCSGGDMSSGRAGGDLYGGSESVVAGRNNLRHSVHAVPRALLNLEKPYIAAVNGAAVGAGMDMASMADIRIASGQGEVRDGLRAGGADAGRRRGLLPAEDRGHVAGAGADVDGANLPGGRGAGDGLRAAGWSRPRICYRKR